MICNGSIETISSFPKIASCIGTLIRIDKVTVAGEIGHHAKVLVDMNLSITPLDPIIVEEMTIVYLEYEKLPLFFNNCSSIGHVVANCFLE